MLQLLQKPLSPLHCCLQRSPNSPLWCHCDLVCAAAMSLQSILQQRGAAQLSSALAAHGCGDVSQPTFPSTDPAPITNRKSSPALSDKANRKYSATLLPGFCHPFHCFLPLHILGEKCLRKLLLPQFRFHLLRQIQHLDGSPSSCPQGGERAGAKGGWNQEGSQHLPL